MESRKQAASRPSPPFPRRRLQLDFLDGGQILAVFVPALPLSLQTVPKLIRLLDKQLSDQEFRRNIIQLPARLRSASSLPSSACVSDQAALHRSLHWKRPQFPFRIFPEVTVAILFPCLSPFLAIHVFYILSYLYFPIRLYAGARLHPPVPPIHRTPGAVLPRSTPVRNILWRKPDSAHHKSRAAARYSLLLKPVPGLPAVLSTAGPGLRTVVIHLQIGQIIRPKREDPHRSLVICQISLDPLVLA